MAGRDPAGKRPLYCPWPRWVPFVPGAAFALRPALRGTSGGASMTTPGGAGTTLPRARHTGFSHGVGAPAVSSLWAPALLFAENPAKF